MTELGWSPEQVGRLTIPQVICLVNEKAPKSTRSARTVAEWEAMMAELAAAEAEWASGGGSWD